jgi:ABC-type multidrug transport system permease subunit
MGVLPSEVILGHTLTQVLIIAGQIAILLVIALLAFQLPMYGSLGLIIVLMGMLGMSGMLYGLVISTISPEETHAMQFSLGSFFPVLLLSGVIWPLEAVPQGLRYVSLALPTTWAAGVCVSLVICITIMVFIESILLCCVASLSPSSLITADAMRSLMLRGWDLSHPGIWGAFLVVFGWILFFLIISLLGVKRVE